MRRSGAGAGAVGGPEEGAAEEDPLEQRGIFDLHGEADEEHRGEAGVGRARGGRAGARGQHGGGEHGQVEEDRGLAAFALGEVQPEDVRDCSGCSAERGGEAEREAVEEDGGCGGKGGGGELVSGGRRRGPSARVAA